MIEIFGKQYITEKEAACRYKYSPAWFRLQRHLNLEPAYINPGSKASRGRGGKVYYPLSETDEFFKKKFKLKDR